MKKVEINGIDYEIVRNDDNCFQKEIIEEKITDYFLPFDYILADYAYERYRLKGFYDSTNKKAKKINDINTTIILFIIFFINISPFLLLYIKIKR